MATDDERRRVARNIRENYIRGGMGYRTASGYNIALAVGIVPEILVDDIELWSRLADLIEPSCDREALLALADGLEADADRVIKAAKSARFGGGPQMGEAKHDAHEWRSIAHCIREACGETANGLPTSHAGVASAGAPSAQLGAAGPCPRSDGAPEKN